MYYARWRGTHRAMVVLSTITWKDCVHLERSARDTGRCGKVQKGIWRLPMKRDGFGGGK